MKLNLGRSHCVWPLFLCILKLARIGDFLKPMQPPGSLNHLLWSIIDTTEETIDFI